MKDVNMETVLRDLLAEVREARTWAALPTVLTKRRAARELSISLSKLKALIRDGELSVCEVGRSTMVPASEVLRIADSARREEATATQRPRQSRKARGTSPVEEARKVRQSLKKHPRRST